MGNSLKLYVDFFYCNRTMVLIFIKHVLLRTTLIAKLWLLAHDHKVLVLIWKEI